MTSLDPSHLPSRHHDHRGEAVLTVPRAGKRHGPPLPDLRFEQSYLLSIKSFVHSTSAPDNTHNDNQPESARQHRHRGEREGAEKLSLVDGGDNKGQASNQIVKSLYGAPISIDWKGILWITARDQVISPLLQGALWGTASIMLLPAVARLGSHVRSQISTALGVSPTRRSSPDDVGFLRRWVRSLTSGVETNVALAK